MKPDARLIGRWVLEHRLLARQLLAGTQAGHWNGSISPAGRPPMPLLIFSQVAWDDVWQRPQELARGLARHRPVLFCSPVQVHQAAGPLRGRWEPERLDVGGNLLVSCPLILSGEYRSAAVRRANRAIMARSLARYLRPRRFLCLTNTPFAEEMLRTLRPSVTAYDIMDDFCAFEWAPREGRRQEARLLRRAHFATAGTWSLYEKFRRRAREIEFLASGVDAEKLTRPRSEPEDLRDLPHPRLLYVGTLNDRVSGELMGKVARAFPNGSLILVGPRRATFRAPAFPNNVHELGLKRHDELGGYYQHCDIGLMPFADNEAARAVNPIKTLEYLSCGLPVISTPVPDVERFYVPPVVVAKPSEWPARMREMIANNNDDARIERRSFAQGRSWGTLVQRMEEKLSRAENEWRRRIR